MKKAVLFLAIIIGAFAFGLTNEAFATSNHVYQLENNSFSSSSPRVIIYQSLGGGISGDSYSFDLYYEVFATSTDIWKWSLAIEEFSTNTYYGGNLTHQWFTNCVEFLATSSAQIHNFPITKEHDGSVSVSCNGDTTATDHITFNPDRYYQLRFSYNQSPGIAPFNIYGATDSSAYINGAASAVTGGLPTNNGETINDLFFIIYGAEYGSSTFPESYSGAYITPIYPTDCYYTENGFSGTAFGTITNPASSTIHWYEFKMGANDYYTGDIVWATTSVDINPGETKNYSIPYSLSDTTLWEIFYFLLGQDINTGEYYYIGHSGVTSCPDDFKTWIGEPASTTLELLQCDLDQLNDDCASTTYSTLEKFTCRVVGALERGVVPTCSSWAKLERYQSALKHRAPYNYVSAFNVFLGELAFPTTTSTTTEELVDTMEGFATMTIFINLRLILKGVLYLIFAVFLFKILRKMFK